jgi:hypothetical protein
MRANVVSMINSKFSLKYIINSNILSIREINLPRNSNRNYVYHLLWDFMDLCLIDLSKDFDTEELLIFLES